jgi:hypothetical protein
MNATNFTFLLQVVTVIAYVTMLALSAECVRSLVRE